MKKSLEDALTRDFPGLYRFRRRELSKLEERPQIENGFETMDGWEPLIRRLSEKLEPMGVAAVQVKEKFGGLRFYLENGNPASDLATDQAEQESWCTCEECGAPGKLRDRNGWLRTRCNKCWHIFLKANPQPRKSHRGA